MANVEHTIGLVTTCQDQASGKMKGIGAAAAQMGQQTTQSLGKMRAGLGAVTLATAAMGGESTSAFGQFSRMASGIAGSFAAGGPILGGIAVLTAGLGFLAEKSRKAEEAEAKRAEASKKAAEESARSAAKIKEETERRDEHNRKIALEIDLLNARSDAEREQIQNREKLRSAREEGGGAGEALEAKRQSAEASAKRRAADAKAAEESLKRQADQTEKIAEHERQLSERARETLKAFRDQVAERFKMLTMSAEERQAADDAAAIKKLEAQGEKEKADALRKGIEYAREKKKYDDDAAKSKDTREKADDAAKKAAEEAKREADARRSVVDALSEQLDIESQTTEEARKRVERIYEENRLRKDGGAEAVRIARELWALEDKRAEAAKKAADAKSASAKRERDSGAAGGAGVGLDTLDDKGDLVEGSLADARKARKDAVRGQKRRRAAIGRGMGRSIHDGRGGAIRSGRRGLGSFSSWYGGSGDMGVHEGGDPVNPSMREPGKKGGKGGSPPQKPGYPEGLGAVTPSDSDIAANMEKAAGSADKVAAAADKAAPAAEKIASGLERAVAPMEKIGSQMETASGNTDKMSTAVEEMSSQVGSFAEKTGSSVSAISNAVGSLKTRLDRIERQLADAEKIGGK